MASVWKIDNDDDEIINPDDLLDEEDKVKPDPSSLRGTPLFHMEFHQQVFHISIVLTNSLRYNGQTKGMQRLFVWPSRRACW